MSERETTSVRLGKELIERAMEAMNSEAARLRKVGINVSMRWWIERLIEEGLKSEQKKGWGGDNE